MKTENLYQPFEIVYKELDECPKQAHKHTFFELVYIVDGTGKQHINENTFQYHKGHLFLISPQDYHHFDVQTTTKFFFIRFNDIYLKAQKGQDTYLGLGNWVKKLEFIVNNNSHLPGCILCNQSDKTLVKALIEGIIKEYVNKELYYQEVVQQIVNTIIAIVARNISLAEPVKVPKNNTDQTALQMVQYIQSNIYHPAALRTEAMATAFGLSATYLSEYFKKHNGESLQQYIINYKLRLVENRLLYSDLRINEIAYELQFTDESHLNRLFKKYKGVSPKAFRKAALMPSPVEELIPVTVL